VLVMVITRRSPMARIVPVATMTPWLGISRGTLALVPSVPGLVRVIVAPRKSSGERRLLRALLTSSS
jgi:hypothetical protein